MGESTVRIGVTTQTGQAETGIKSVKGLLQGLATQAKSSILTGVGIGAGISAFGGLQTVVADVTGYLKDAVGAASDFNESQSKAEVVFGASAKEIQRWAATAATSMGISNQAALEAAGTFGNLFTAMGLAVPTSAEMSEKIVQLASDLASFNNANPEDVLIALRAGLVGETEPLRKFGINLTDATLRQEAMALGLTKTTSQVLPASVKAQAAYSLILKQSTTAQGDFARTSDGLANTQRTVSAEFEDLSVQIGQALLPVVVELAHFTRDTLIPQISNLTQKIKDAKPIWDALAFAIGKVWQTAGDSDMAADLANNLHEQFLGPIKRIPPDTAAVLREGMGAIEREVSAGGDAIVADAEATGKAIPKATADGMLAAQQELADPIKQLRQFITDSLIPAQVIARDQGFLASKALAAGLASNNPLVATKAAELRAAAIIELSKTTMFTSGGYMAGISWAQGFKNSYSYAYSSVYGWLYGLKQLLVGNSPPPKGPLRNIDKGAANVGAAWSKGFNLGMGNQVGLVPSIAGSGGSSGGLSIAAAGGGSPVVIQLQVDGRTLAEIVDRQLYYQRPVSGPLGKG